MPSDSPPITDDIHKTPPLPGQAPWLFYFFPSSHRKHLCPAAPPGIFRPAASYSSLALPGRSRRASSRGAACFFSLSTPVHLHPPPPLSSPSPDRLARTNRAPRTAAMNEDEAIQSINKKIEREKALINAANAMRSQTNNEAVRSRLDSQMRDGRRNLQFFEEKLRDIQMRRVGQGVEGMSLGGDDAGAPPPPPKDASSGWADQASYGQQGQAGPPSDLAPPRHNFGAPGPGAASKARPNFTKLGTFYTELLLPSPRIPRLFFLPLVSPPSPLLLGGIRAVANQLHFCVQI